MLLLSVYFILVFAQGTGCWLEGLRKAAMYVSLSGCTSGTYMLLALPHRSLHSRRGQELGCDLFQMSRNKASGVLLERDRLDGSFEPAAEPSRSREACREGSKELMSSVPCPEP